MPKFKADDAFMFEDMEFVVQSVEDEGYVVRRVDSEDPGESQLDRTFLFDDEPDMHLVETKPVNLGLEARAAKKRGSKHN